MEGHWRGPGGAVEARYRGFPTELRNWVPSTPEAVSAPNFPQRVLEQVGDSPPMARPS